ncbi:MAG: hypothetical protein IJU29_08455 [Oscillospiraceae bacterium]|nr:hypothetical protein [Oscillospiraceae bacterium]
MANALAAAEMNRPNFTGRESTDIKLDELEDYLYFLLEQLKYAFGNIGPDNFNTAEVNNYVGEVVREYAGEFVHTLQMDFSKWDEGYFTELLDNGKVQLYTVVTDAGGNPIVITDGVNAVRVFW